MFLDHDFFLQFGGWLGGWVGPVPNWIIPIIYFFNFWTLPFNIECLKKLPNSWLLYRNPQGVVSPYTNNVPMLHAMFTCWYVNIYTESERRVLNKINYKTYIFKLVSNWMIKEDLFSYSFKWLYYFIVEYLRHYVTNLKDFVHFPNVHELKFPTYLQKLLLLNRSKIFWFIGETLFIWVM